MAENCPVCESLLNEARGVAGGIFFSCPLCGEFKLTDSLVADLPDTLQRNKEANKKISHAIRLMQNNSKVAELSSYTVDEVLKRSLPSPKEQADLLIRWLAENTEGPGNLVQVGPSTHSSIVGAKSPKGFELVLNHLFDIGLVIGTLNGSMGHPGKALASLSFDGWDYYDQLRQGGVTYRKAFMAMKFGDDHLDLMLENIFKPSVKKAGFDLLRLDDLPKAGLIDDRLRVEIQSSDFIIADLTHDNLGAYWEAGYAEGLGKPVIYTCEKEKFENEKTHFDTNHHLTIIWDKNHPESAGENLKATIRATLPELSKHDES